MTAQLKILLTEPVGAHTDRQRKVQDVLGNVAQPYDSFSQFFNKLRTEDKVHLLDSALTVFWQHFCPWHASKWDLENNVGNQQDPGDGQLYGSEDIDRANAFLRHLHQAWSNMEDSALYPPPDNLLYMGRICLILAGMRQLQLLQHFLLNRICDNDLHLSRDQLLGILQGQHAVYVGTFLSEQYRAQPRSWDRGHHAKMEDVEPLPLTEIKSYNNGSYGMVLKVKDIDGKEYALKKQKPSSVYSNNVRARKHLKDELDRLRGLEHKHVIQLVKSYERADLYGLVLTPAATTDLVYLLLRYRKNNFNHIIGCQDQKWLRPIFLTAFGCLSQGLAYTHRRGIRHKDIKPGNILYEQGNPENDGSRFLWADFGLAYDFSTIGNSKTNSTSIYSKRYAAPEVFMTNDHSVGPRPDPSVGTVGLGRITEVSTNGEASQNDESGKPEDQDPTQDDINADLAHGRKTDIFSLGCVFLEILAVLANESLPMDRNNQNSIHRSNANWQLPNGGPAAGAGIGLDDEKMFCQCLNELKEWAQSHSTTSRAPSNAPNPSSSNASLAPLFDLAIKMISWSATDRPFIDEVVCSVATIGKNHFCEKCWEELPTDYKTENAMALVPIGRVAKPKRTESMGPESPGSGSAKSLLKRSATGIFRIDSHGPGTLKKIISR